MMITPPVAAAQAGQATGGGLLDTFKNAIGSVTGAAPTQAASAGPKGDGSVGIFDGVLKKALFGGAAGAAIGFIPFLPGGPVLGGIVGALGGAAMGLFSNWRTMQSIKKENEAMLAAMGVQTQHPEVQKILQSGNVEQLIPLMQSAQQGGVTQQTTQQTSATRAELAAQQQAAVTQGQLPTVVDPSAAQIAQSPVPTQGTIAVGSGGVGGAINPNRAVNPGVAPALSQGGGGTEAAAGVDALHVNPEKLAHADLLKMIDQLQQRIDQLKALIDEQERASARERAALQGEAAATARQRVA